MPEDRIERPAPVFSAQCSTDELLRHDSEMGWIGPLPPAPEGAGDWGCLRWVSDHPQGCPGAFAGPGLCCSVRAAKRRPASAAFSPGGTAGAGYAVCRLWREGWGPLCPGPERSVPGLLGPLGVRHLQARRGRMLPALPVVLRPFCRGQAAVRWLLDSCPVRGLVPVAAVPLLDVPRFCGRWPLAAGFGPCGTGGAGDAPALAPLDQRHRAWSSAPPVPSGCLFQSLVGWSALTQWFPMGKF